jgi:DNA-binding NarL/FixJ family response regulator
MSDNGENLTAQTDTIRILLVDDQRVFLEGLKFVLESRASDIEVVGIGLNGKEAISLVERHRPDIILMDVRMPEMNGVEATQIIHTRFPDVKILMFTTFDDDEYVESALSYGAIGYLLKNRPPIELITAIRGVKNGILQIDPSVAQVLLRHDSSTREHDDTEIIALIDTLTVREKEVLNLIAQALDNKQIADHLFVAEQTARNYIHSIYSKLGISNRIEIIRILERIDY